MKAGGKDKYKDGSAGLYGTSNNNLLTPLNNLLTPYMCQRVCRSDVFRIILHPGNTLYTFILPFTMVCIYRYTPLNTSKYPINTLYKHHYTAGTVAKVPAAFIEGSVAVFLDVTASTPSIKNTAENKE